MQATTDPRSLRRICVVGASVAGLHAVRTLRQHGYQHKIVWIGAEPHLPYDRPPLSKQLLTGEWDTPRVALLDETGVAQLGADLRLGTPATGLDLAGRRVRLAGGGEVGFDGLVIATGTVPRTLPGLPALEGVVTLRTLDESLRLRSAVAGGARVVVVGAGFIGLEVAASCRAQGAEVTVVEAAPAPFGGRYGATLGDACVRLHKANGVELRFADTVAAVDHRAAAVTGVRLGSGPVLPVDVVVVGVGVRPAVDWLVDCGLAIGDGVECDAGCFAAPHVVAAGDVACWYNTRTGAPTRVEHWTNATEQGKVAAANLLLGQAGAQPYAPAPYFWSDQYGRRIQFAGVLVPGARQVTVGGADQFLTVYGRGEELVAVLGFAQPGPFMRLRRMLVDGASFSDAVAVASG